MSNYTKKPLQVPNYDYGNLKVAINSGGYLIWKMSAGRSRKTGLHTSWRDWKLVKYAEHRSANGEYIGEIGTIGKIRMPARFIGKRVRVKFEIIDDEPTPKKKKEEPLWKRKLKKSIEKQ